MVIQSFRYHLHRVEFKVLTSSLKSLSCQGKQATYLYLKHSAVNYNCTLISELINGRAMLIHGILLMLL